MSEENRKMHILIVNQHGENRGDESAMRAMVDGLATMLDDTKYSIIVQFQDTNLKLHFQEDVSFLHMKMSPITFFGMVIYALFRKIGIKVSPLLNNHSRKIIESYATADMVISAPGGPYFGDIYYKHELLHWFYVWLADLYRKPLFLYAPSAGPFRKKPMNILRRHLFKKFDVLCVRENLSRRYLIDLLGNGTAVHVTADAAIQQQIRPYPRKSYFTGHRKHLLNKYLVAVSAIEYKFPGEPNPRLLHEKYSDILTGCLHHLMNLRDCHFMFFPQLYGKVHNDVPYLERLGNSLPSSASWEIVDSRYDSNKQRRLFGMVDISIASRYHPQIFAITSGVPGICVYYEHKTLGFMLSLGLDDLAFDIRNLDSKAICGKLDEIVQKRDDLSKLILDLIPTIRNTSKQTTILAAELLKRKSLKHS
jgi:colanic acid/amylovoran biosynthesis protein